MNTVSTSEYTSSEKIQFRILFTVSYLLLIFFVIANRLLPKKLKMFGSSNSAKSIFKETKELVNSTIPIAFMS